MWEWYIHGWPLVCHLTRDWTYNPGLCADQESNQRALALWGDAQPTEPHWSGLTLSLDVICSPFIFQRIGSNAIQEKLFLSYLRQRGSSIIYYLTVFIIYVQTVSNLIVWAISLVSLNVENITFLFNLSFFSGKLSLNSFQITLRNIYTMWKY